MKKLLQTLTEAIGPSGYEDEVREVVRREIESLADETRVDTLGNLIAHKAPGKATKESRKIMIAAHMDESGVMVSHVDENGFVRFSPIGNVTRSSILGSRVCFLNGSQGVVGCDPQENANELPPLGKVYIDVGATSRKDCPVKIGDVAAFDRPYFELGDRLVAKSMDNRVGVMVAIETLRKLESAPYDIYFVFTTQQEVGARGAMTSTYDVDPDVGIALNAASAGDTPGSHGTETALGKGPCIRIQDGRMIADPRVVNWMVRAAEKKKIPYQREVLTDGSSEVRMIQLTRAGVPAGCISIPVRYVHSSSEMVDIRDVHNTVKLLTAVLQTRIEL